MKKDDVIKTFNLLLTDKNTRKIFNADISARVPYRLHCCVYNFNREVWVEDDILYNYDLGGNCQTLKILNERGACLMYYQIRPYLRPMSNMTVEEKKIVRSYGFELIPYDTGYTGFANIENCIDEVSFRFMEEFLNAHHFDYRGLIPKGLAIEAPDGMYK